MYYQSILFDRFPASAGGPKYKSMKSTLLLLTMTLLLALSACRNNESDRIRDEARQTLPVAPPASTVAAPTAPAFPTFDAAPHYKCPNNCSGGIGNAAGVCPVCGTQMAHNQAYHDQLNANTSTATPSVNSNTPTPTPAQNAAGVFHYTCSNGCAGGGANPVACSTCGSMLVHNQAYHGN